MDKTLTCWECKDKKVTYRDKIGKEYCYECYWSLEENKYSKPKGDLFSDNDYYRSCPFCNSGDICSTTWCIAKCKHCGIVDKLSRAKYEGQNYCSKCIDIVREESEEKSSEERQKKADEISKQIKRLSEIEPENLTIEEYREVKNLQKQLEVLIGECNREADFNPGIILKKSILEELEKSFPEQVKIQAKKKECDTHKKITWEEQNKAYCLDCGENKSENFLKELQKLMVKDIRNICSQHGISSRDLEVDYADLAVLKRGKPSSQEQLWKLYRNIRANKLDNKKSNSNISNVNNNNSNINIRERERERERANSTSAIPTPLPNTPIRKLSH